MREVRAPDSPDKLSERETEVLRLVASGMANKAIARELGITERTVKAHVGSILGKLHLGEPHTSGTVCRSNWTDSAGADRRRSALLIPLTDTARLDLRPM